MVVEFGLGVLLAIVVPLGTICVLALLVVACVTLAASQSFRRRYRVCGAQRRPMPKIGAEPPRLSLEIDNESHLSGLNHIYGPLKTDSIGDSLHQTYSRRSTRGSTRRPQAPQLESIAEQHQPAESRGGLSRPGWPPPIPPPPPPTSFTPTDPISPLGSMLGSPLEPSLMSPLRPRPAVQGPQTSPRKGQKHWSPQPVDLAPLPLNISSTVQPHRVAQDPQVPAPPSPAAQRYSARQSPIGMYGLPEVHSVENHPRMKHTHGIDSISASIITRPVSEQNLSMLSIQQTPLSVYAPSPATTQYYTPNREIATVSSDYATPTSTSDDRHPNSLKSATQPRSSPASWRQRSSSAQSNQSRLQRQSTSTVRQIDKPLPRPPEGPEGGGVVANLQGQTFKAIYQYTPVLYDELALTPGEVVYCYQIFDDGWCKVIKASSSDQGICPLACLAQV